MTAPVNPSALGMTAFVEICSPIDPTVACRQRHEAIHGGSFWPSRMGWVWNTGAEGMSTVKDCPWCQGRLPILTPAMLKAMDTDDAN